MKKFGLALLMSTVLFGCASSSKTALVTPTNKDKVAELEYTDIGVTSGFKFENIATGTMKAFGYEAGLVVYAGEQKIEVNLDAAQKWNIKAESQRTSVGGIKGIGVSLKNPYLGVVRRDGKVIGKIGIDLPEINAKNEVLEYVGLDGLANTNLDLTGGAKILGVQYKLGSVYKDAEGNESGSPYGYKVTKGGKLVGTVTVGKNMFGGQELTVWLKGEQPAIQEQSVMSILLTAGWAI
ncbi:hypothetical protein L3Q72_12485 [Vibrio sp. JC009]|uniref:hypothetical protein n=1 Tax=Vibrio sp. JC009 TaxID=2912314 RepID=UPI0023AFAE4D|nr:hypothetical protein [Vibrio sp. JC009]WED21439.1 hypothetical protein L3Q72_12485 [Vibrio sp. JC009]